ncbi:MAG: SEC-C domain-containing protein [Clostridiales bacterium]|nr:SEC-C domain-containing protein [Clostridiales bacterium]
MSYFDLWNERSENTENQELYTAYVTSYYDKEKAAYDKIFREYPDRSGISNVAALPLALKLGYSREEMDLFLGFLDGINPSLKEKLDLPSVTDETLITLEIDYEKLYINMREAKADWLYSLNSWKNVFSQDELDRMAIRFRESKIIRSEKIGRNDPCPCGSGKKYKQCCMNK